MGFLIRGRVAMRTLKQPRALETRERILSAATRLFALKGYHDAKLEEILRTAEVTTGAFFHHFRSKEDLGFAVIDRHMEKRAELVEQIERRMPPAGEDEPLAQVFRRLDALEGMVQQRAGRRGGCVIGNLSTSLSDTHDSFRERLAACFDSMALEFEPHLKAAARKYCPTRRVDTRGLARYIVAIIEGSIMLARTYQDRRMVRRHFDHLKDHLRKALGA